MSRVAVLLALGLAAALAAAAQGFAPDKAALAGTAAQIDYAGFARLTDDVAAYRAKRLVSLAQFKRLAAEPGALVLDARSQAAFAEGHIEGAVNLPFSDFTAEKLAAVIGDKDRRILIYCNNNFSNNIRPVVMKSAPLALNIPTFINLYGYGYANIYELGEVVDLNDPAVAWVAGR